MLLNLHCSGSSQKLMSCFHGAANPMMTILAFIEHRSLQSMRVQR